MGYTLRGYLFEGLWLWLHKLYFSFTVVPTGMRFAMVDTDWEVPREVKGQRIADLLGLTWLKA